MINVPLQCSVLYGPAHIIDHSDHILFLFPGSNAVVYCSYSLDALGRVSLLLASGSEVAERYGNSIQSGITRYRCVLERRCGICILEERLSKYNHKTNDAVQYREDLRAKAEVDNLSLRVFISWRGRGTGNFDCSAKGNPAR